jgi:hypothetical protein
MDVSGQIPIESIPVLDASANATAVFEVSLADMQSCFQYQTDSSDITDVDSTDIRYYVNPASWPTLNPANGMMNHAQSTNQIAVSSSTGDYPSNKMLVAHDFVRYLALKLFNTQYGVDLFNNEVDLLKGIRRICDESSAGHTWYDIVSKINAVGTSGTNANIVGTDGSKYMTNADTSTANLGRALLQQLLGSVPERFSNINATDSAQPLPFQEGDSISFKLTIAPADGQEDLTGVAAFSARSYEIRLVMVSTTPSNTAVDALETA